MHWDLALNITASVNKLEHACSFSLTWHLHVVLRNEATALSITCVPPLLESSTMLLSLTNYYTN